MSDLEVPIYNKVNILNNSYNSYDLYLNNSGLGNNVITLPPNSVGSVIGCVMEPKMINDTGTPLQLSIANNGVQVYNGSICGSAYSSTPNVNINIKDNIVINGSSNIGSVYNTNFALNTGGIGSPWNSIVSVSATVELSGAGAFGLIGGGSMVKETIAYSDPNHVGAVTYNTNTITDNVSVWNYVHAASGVISSTYFMVGTNQQVSPRTTVSDTGNLSIYMNQESGAGEIDFYFSSAGSIIATGDTGKWYKFKIGIDRHDNTASFGIFDSGTTPVVKVWESGISYDCLANPIRQIRMWSRSQRGTSNSHFCDLRSEGSYSKYVSGGNNINFKPGYVADGILLDSNSRIIKNTSNIKVTQTY